MEQTRRRNALLMMCFLVYSISYIGKYSYSTNIQNVITDFGVSKAYAGYATSAFFFCYGIGQLVNGILCERINSRWAITFSGIGSALITGTMFFLKDVFVMTVLWGINGIVLSLLWCHCIKLLAKIPSEGYVEKSAMVMALTLPVGIVFAYGLSALFTYLNIWKAIYILSAGLLFGTGVLFFCVVGKVEYKTEEEEKAIEFSNEKNEGGSLFRVFGFLVIPLFIVCIGTGLLRDGTSTWLPVLLGELYRLPDFFSILLTLGLPLTGVFTSMISARLMERIKNVFGACCIAGILAVLLMAVLVFTFDRSFVLLVGMFMLISLVGYVLGNTLTSILPLYYKSQLKSGQTAGIINASVYLGSTISTLFLGGLASNMGWLSFMITLFITSAMIAIMSLLGVCILRRETKKQL